MSNRRELPTETRTIHARALHTLGEEAAIVMLGVARDLRSGVIPPDEYEQARYYNDAAPCGTPNCIGGHTAARLGLRSHAEVIDWVVKVSLREGVDISWIGLHNLFNPGHPSVPHLAADSIERYVYEGADDPWAA